MGGAALQLTLVANSEVQLKLLELFKVGFYLYRWYLGSLLALPGQATASSPSCGATNHICSPGIGVRQPGHHPTPCLSRSTEQNGTASTFVFLIFSRNGTGHFKSNAHALCVLRWHSNEQGVAT